MADRRLRKLERDAQLGEPGGGARLAHERARVGHAQRDAWEAAYAVDGALRETVQLLEHALQTAQRLRSLNNERGSATTWQDAWEAAYSLGLARKLDAALTEPSVDPTESLTTADRAVVGAVRRAVEELSTVVGGVPYWADVLQRYGVSTPPAVLEAAFERIATASSVKHRWLVKADLRFAHLSHGSFSARRRSGARSS